MLRVKNHSVFDVFTKYFLGGAQRAPKIDFGRVLAALWEPLGTSFGHVGGSVALLGHRLGPKWRIGSSLCVYAKTLPRLECEHLSRRVESSPLHWSDPKHVETHSLFVQTSAEERANPTPSRGQKE